LQVVGESDRQLEAPKKAFGIVISFFLTAAPVLVFAQQRYEKKYK
jgi:hypothetical protein